MLTILAVAIFWFYTTFDRDPLLSVMNGSNPFEFSVNWSMIKTVAPAVGLAALGFINQVFPEMLIWLQNIIQPLARTTG
jgi:hypothetical protein